MTRRSLDDARQITSVLQSRISDRVSLDPVGDTFAEWTPTVDNPQWQAYLSTLAQAADDRRNQLGRAAATDTPAWAIEALGPPPLPDRPAERAGWEKRAASVAAYRELVAHTDESDPLGSAAQARPRRDLRRLASRLASPRPARSRSRRGRDVHRPAPAADPCLRA